MIAAGIDFGDQNCVVAVPAAFGVDVIPNQASTRLTPSQVTYTPNRRYAGIFSKQMQTEYINTTFTDLKRLIGLPYNSAERETIQKIVAFPLVPLPDGLTGIELDHGNGHPIILPPIQCIGYLLKEISSLALDRNPQINNFVIVVSPWWSPLQRRSLLHAASIAGIHAQLLNSTTAAAISYAFIQRERLPTSGRPVPVCLVDFGNSSLNVAIAMMKPGQVTVISSASDPTLGGSHFTDALVPFLVEKIQKLQNAQNSRSEIRDDFSSPRTLHRLRCEAERIKKCLSVNAVVQCEWSTPFPVKREEFLALVQPLLSRIAAPISRALAAAKVRPPQLAAAEALGGACRIPAVREAIAKALCRDVEQLGRSLDMDECFAQGAGYFAASLQPHSKISLAVRDVSLHPIFAEVASEPIKLLPALTTTPASASFKLDVIGEAHFSICEEPQNFGNHTKTGNHKNFGNPQNFGNSSNFGNPQNFGNGPDGEEYVVTADRECEVTVKVELTASLTVDVVKAVGRGGAKVKVEPLQNQEVEKLVVKEREHSQQDVSALAAEEAKNDLEAVLIKVQNFGKTDNNSAVFSKEMAQRIVQAEQMLEEVALQSSETYTKLAQELMDDERDARRRAAAFRDLYNSSDPLESSLNHLLREISASFEEAKSLKTQELFQELQCLESDAQSLLLQLEQISTLKQDEDPPEYPFEAMKSRVLEMDEKKKTLVEKIHREKALSSPKPQPGAGWESFKSKVTSTAKGIWG